MKILDFTLWIGLNRLIRSISLRPRWLFGSADFVSTVAVFHVSDGALLEAGRDHSEFGGALWQISIHLVIKIGYCSNDLTTRRCRWSTILPPPFPIIHLICLILVPQLFNTKCEGTTLIKLGLLLVGIVQHVFTYLTRPFTQVNLLFLGYLSKWVLILNFLVTIAHQIWLLCSHFSPPLI